MVAKALVAEECKKREAREAFPLSSVAVSVQAAQEFTKSNQQEVDEGNYDCDAILTVPFGLYSFYDSENRFKIYSQPRVENLMLF